MRQSLVVVFATLVMLSPLRASLGDGHDTIEDSYGSIVRRQLHDDGTVSVVYQKKRYLYSVTFANRRSISESYSHVDGTDLSEKEITRFLKANAAGKTWASVNASKERRFKRSDGKAEATYASTDDRPTLTVRELDTRP